MNSNTCEIREVRVTDLLRELGWDARVINATMTSNVVPGNHIIGTFPNLVGSMGKGLKRTPKIGQL